MGELASYLYLRSVFGGKEVLGSYTDLGILCIPWHDAQSTLRSSLTERNDVEILATYFHIVYSSSYGN